MTTQYRIEYLWDGNWLSAIPEWPNCGLFDSKEGTNDRVQELWDELSDSNEGISFRVVEC